MISGIRRQIASVSSASITGTNTRSRRKSRINVTRRAPSVGRAAPPTPAGCRQAAARSCSIAWMKASLSRTGSVITNG